MALYVDDTVLDEQDRFFTEGPRVSVDLKLSIKVPDDSVCLKLTLDSGRSFWKIVPRAWTVYQLHTELSRSNMANDQYDFVIDLPPVMRHEDGRAPLMPNTTIESLQKG